MDVDILLSQRCDEIEHVAVDCLGVLDGACDLRDHFVFQGKVVVTNRGLELGVSDRYSPGFFGARGFFQPEHVFDLGH
ncbi:hypothetical protein D3C80_2089500 [compost metagenome]